MANFKRKSNDMDGVFTLHVGNDFEPDIKIVGRAVYETDDKKEIEALKNDPNIVEIEVNRKGKVKIIEE